MCLGSEAGGTNKVVSQTTEVLLPAIAILCLVGMFGNPSCGVRVPSTQAESGEQSLSSPVKLEKAVDWFVFLW